MTRSWGKVGVLAAGALFVGLLLPSPALGQSADPGRWKRDVQKPGESVTAHIEGSARGYELQITVRTKREGSPLPAPVTENEGRASRPESKPSHPGDSESPRVPGTSRERAPSVGPGAQLAAGPATANPQRAQPQGTSSVTESSRPNTTVVPITVTVWGPRGDGTQQQLGQTPENLGYYTYVEGWYSGITWQAYPPGPAIQTENVPPLPPDVRPGGGGGPDPYSVALDILAHIPLPDMRIRMNPTLGLVALRSWYWVEGYGGQPFGESRTVTIPPANPLDPNDRGISFTVEVRVWPSRYEWSFGDGKGFTTSSLGKSYPAESDIQHTYEHSSLAYPGGFPVRMTAEFAAEFRVNGGGPQGLPPVRRTYESAFRVQEIQPVLVQRR